MYKRERVELTLKISSISILSREVVEGRRERGEVVSWTPTTHFDLTDSTWTEANNMLWYWESLQSFCSLGNFGQTRQTTRNEFHLDLLSPLAGKAWMNSLEPSISMVIRSRIQNRGEWKSFLLGKTLLRLPSFNLVRVRFLFSTGQNRGFLIKTLTMRSRPFSFGSSGESLYNRRTICFRILLVVTT